MSSTRISPALAAKLGIVPPKADKPRKPRRRRAEYLARYAATPPATLRSAEDREKQRALFERHDRVIYRFRIPLGPSVNDYFKPLGPKGSFVLTTEGKAYKEAVKAAWASHWNGRPPEPVTGRLRLLLLIHFADARVQDLSNRLKAIEDSLGLKWNRRTEKWEGAGVYRDDGQIDDNRQLRGDIVKPYGAVDVIIETLEDA